MPDPYEPERYWSERLGQEFTLRGTGHVSYSQSYNRWAYRVKKRALDGALAGVPSGSRVLALGSGVGWGVSRLLDRGYRVEGCDITTVAVERLSARFPQASFFTLAVGSDEIPRPAGTYDAATMLDVAYHITDDQLWRAALEDLARVLRP